MAKATAELGLAASTNSHSCGHAKKAAPQTTAANVIVAGKSGWWVASASPATLDPRASNKTGERAERIKHLQKTDDGVSSRAYLGKRFAGIIAAVMIGVDPTDTQHARLRFASDYCC